jgi:hypothetical protein
MGRIPSAGFDRIVPMDHDHTSDRIGRVVFENDAETRYTNYQMVIQLNRIAVALESILWAVFLGAVLFGAYELFGCIMESFQGRKR